MAEKENLRLLKGLISNLAIRDLDKFDTYFLTALENITSGEEDGSWSEEKYPEIFESLREILTLQKNWVTSDKINFDQVKLWREAFPRSHWWWWIEEL